MPDLEDEFVGQGKKRVRASAPALWSKKPPAEKRRRTIKRSATPRFVRWLDTQHGIHKFEFHGYMQSVAEARYIIRKIQHMVDACAAEQGLEPLEHQALVQVCGAPARSIPVGQISERLDIASSALASRLVNRLEILGLVTRTRSAIDRRTITVAITAKGEALLHAVVENLHREVTYFQSKLDAGQQRSAMDIFSFYVGIKPQPRWRKE